MNDINNATRNCDLYEALADASTEDGSVGESGNKGSVEALGGFQTATYLMGSGGEKGVEALGGFQTASSFLSSGGETGMEALGGFQAATSLMGSGKEKGMDKDKVLDSAENKQSRMSALGTGFKTAASLIKYQNSSTPDSSLQKNVEHKTLDKSSDSNSEVVSNNLEFIQPLNSESERRERKNSLKSIQLELSDKVKNDLQEITARYNAPVTEYNCTAGNGNKSILKTYTLSSDNTDIQSAESSDFLKVSPKANVMKIDFSKWEESPAEETTVEDTEQSEVVSETSHSESSSSKRYLDIEFYKDHKEARKRQKSSTSDASTAENAQSSSRRKYSDSDNPNKQKNERAEERKKAETERTERHRKQREGVADNVIKLLQPLYDKQCIPNKEIFKKAARFVNLRCRCTVT